MSTRQVILSETVKNWKQVNLYLPILVNRPLMSLAFYSQTRLRSGYLILFFVKTRQDIFHTL